MNEKKAELENLKELRDLSAAVASQMEALEQKLGTLSDGTEGVLSCWAVAGLILPKLLTFWQPLLWSSLIGIMC